MDGAEIKKQIQEKARELGFDACRITMGATPEHAEQFEGWLAAQRQGEMGYLERNAFKRVDPGLVLAGVKSVVILAASYQLETDTAAHAPASSSQRFGGVVARYARFADYHDIMGERLKVLSSFMDSLGGPGTRSLWYVDTGPILERDLAQRAGLGFAGKHTNLISRELGNWFFLAEILTTLELPPDEGERNRCGACTRCLEACPTQAIVAPFQVDARRCISYLTIELKGAIPVEFRTAIGNRIYGCDDCLAACPWNRFAREGRLMKEHARPEFAQPDLLELLSLDDAGFKKRFAGTPILRTKRRGLLRNVCVALGNIGDESAIPALERATLDREPLIVEHAWWAIAQIRERQERETGRKAEGQKG